MSKELESLRGWLQDESLELIQEAVNRYHSYTPDYLDLHGYGCIEIHCATCYAWYMIDYDKEGKRVAK